MYGQQRNSDQKEHYYMMVLRGATMVVALTLAYISANFSVKGFDFSIPNMEWAGWALSISLIVLELVLNRSAQNLDGISPTILVVGALAYAYGIWTNFMGIVSAQGLALEYIFSSPATLVNAVFPTALSLILEIIPEPLFMWGMMGYSFGGDFITLFTGGGGGRKGQAGQNKKGNAGYSQPMQGKQNPPGQYKGGQQQPGRQSEPTYQRLGGQPHVTEASYPYETDDDLLIPPPARPENRNRGGGTYPPGSQPGQQRPSQSGKHFQG